MSFDIYSRTSNPAHHETAREFFADFLAKGYLIDREEEQFYDESASMFLPDRYVEGICPNCGNDKARGDQCDSCGAYYNQLELKSPKSLVSGKSPIVRKTVHYYMRFDLFQEFLENYIESHATDWKDNVLQQTRSWLKQGLAERAITRDLSWGVGLDGIEGVSPDKSNGKVLYVWFEAVLGYISATKELISNFAAEGKSSKSDWELWWKDPDTRYLAFIGKDNIVFHTLIFPALLHARGGYILPDNVPANEFLNLEGQKFSKSRNWSIDLKDFITDFPDEQSIDILRYTLALNLPETRDADFTWKDFQIRNNNELASILGNFINRTVQFIYKNFNGRVPELTGQYKELVIESKKAFEQLTSGSYPEQSTILNRNDIQLFDSLVLAFKAVEQNYSRFRFRDAVTETMNLARAANKYFNDEEPWKTIKADPEQCAKTLFICIQLVRTLSLAFAPIIPNAAARMNKILNIGQFAGNSENYSFGTNLWDNALDFALPEGSQLGEAQILFSRIEDNTIEDQISKLGDKKAPEEELISIEDFGKIKLRTAVVLEAEKVPKSKKLLKLKVDLGTETRQILAGIAEHYSPEDMIGKTIVVVANLKPAKLMGLESQGMLLAANAGDGKLTIVAPENAGIGIGAEVR
jgi:methionyl-tRNA synthetase